MYVYSFLYIYFQNINKACYKTWVYHWLFSNQQTLQTVYNNTVEMFISFNFGTKVW
jgi:hypothetical protein